MKKIALSALTLALLAACGGSSNTPPGLSVYVPDQVDVKTTTPTPTITQAPLPTPTVPPPAPTNTPAPVPTGGGSGQPSAPPTTTGRPGFIPMPTGATTVPVPTTTGTPMPTVSPTTVPTVAPPTTPPTPTPTNSDNHNGSFVFVGTDFAPGPTPTTTGGIANQNAYMATDVNSYNSSVTPTPGATTTPQPPIDHGSQPYDQVTFRKGLAFSNGSATDNVSLAQDFNLPLTDGVNNTSSDVHLTANVNGVQLPIQATLNLNSNNQSATDSSGQKYVQRVHVVGAASMPAGINQSELPVQMAYTHGKTTDAAAMQRIYDEAAARASATPSAQPGPTSISYAGSATYNRYNSREIITADSSAGAVSGVHATLDLTSKKLKNLELGFNNQGVQNIGDAGNPWDTPNNEFDVVGNMFKTANFDSGSINSGPNPAKPQTKGYFYGDKADAIGGTFYDSKGMGTYMGTKQQ